MWEEADQFCREREAHLVRMENETEFNLIQNLITENPSEFHSLQYWINTFPLGDQCNLVSIFHLTGQATNDQNATMVKYELDFNWIILVNKFHTSWSQRKMLS